MLVQLDQFEGPLGLLLYLIRKEEMDIYDIPIHRITSQYLSYIKQLPAFDLEQAGDFVAMAASLIQIKARMLLPNYNEDGEEIEEEDPRKPLVQQLLEYQKYQEASKDLYERELLGRDTWKRGRKEDISADDAGIELEESALFSLIASYRTVIRKAEKAKHTVTAKFQTIASRILEISHRIKPGIKVTLKDLMGMDEWTRTRYLITFLSTLELGKLGYVKLFQAEDCGDLHIEGRKDIEGDVVAHVAEYDDGQSKTEPPVETAAEIAILSEEPTEEEMASDEEIFAAENELAAQTPLAEEASDVEGENLQAISPKVHRQFESDDEASGIDIDAINQAVEASLNNGGRKVEDGKEEAQDESTSMTVSDDLETEDHDRLMDSEA